MRAWFTRESFQLKIEYQAKKLKMSFVENMELWTELNGRLQILRAALEDKARTDNTDVKREVAKCLYNHGYISTKLDYCRPAPEQPVAAQATELAALQHEVNVHEAASNAI